jgi:hypothetical protein
MLLHAPKADRTADFYFGRYDVVSAYGFTFG